MCSINLQSDGEVSFHPKMKEFPVWSWSTPQAPDVRKIKNINKMEWNERYGTIVQYKLLTCCWLTIHTLKARANRGEATHQLSCSTWVFFLWLGWWGMFPVVGYCSQTLPELPCCSSWPTDMKCSHHTVNKEITDYVFAYISTEK